MLKRRDMLKIMATLPILAYSDKSNAFLQGLILRFIARSVSSLFARSAVRKIAADTIPRVSLAAARGARVSPKAYKLTPSSRERIDDIIKGIDTASNIIDIGSTIWDHTKENHGTAILTHSSEDDFEVPETTIKIIGQDGEDIPIILPSMILKANEAYALQIGYQGSSGKKDFYIQQGTASKMLESILVAKNNNDSYKSQPDEETKPSNSASQLCNDVLGDC